MNKLKLGMIICLALMLMLTPVLSGCAKEEAPPPPPEKPIIIRCSGGAPVEPGGATLKEFETIIPEETNGRVKFEYYPFGQLYGPYDALTAVQSGAIEMAVGGIYMAPISKGMNTIGGVPFLFDDRAHYQRFTKTDGYKAMNDRLEAKGIKHLADWGTPGPGQFFNSKRAVQKLEDFKGLKIRMAPVPALAQMAVALGIESVTVEGAEVLSALETRMVDGVIAAGANITMYRLAENCPYATKCSVCWISITIVVNAKWWNSLPSDIQQVLQRVFDEAGQECAQRYAADEEQLWAEFEAAPGTIISEITVAEKARWLEAVKPIWETAIADEEVREIIEAAESVR